jgi:hypothetical protein
LSLASVSLLMVVDEALEANALELNKLVGRTPMGGSPELEVQCDLKRLALYFASDICRA